eukprot:6008109-Prymnesium_polylepis.1
MVAARSSGKKRRRKSGNDTQSACVKVCTPSPRRRTARAEHPNGRPPPYTAGSARPARASHHRPPPAAPMRAADAQLACHRRVAAT